MVDNDDSIAVSLDVRQPFVQDAPAKQIDGQTMFGGGSESAVQTWMVRVSHLAMHLEEHLAELDINPLMVLPSGQGVKAADALVVLRGT